jgi:hypothetical protein
MRKFLSVVIMLCFCISAFAQLITGFVFDEKTKRQLNSVLIYFDGTFTATVTDKNGHFIFDISKYPSIPVTISSSGYVSVRMEVVTPEKPVQIFLTPKIFESKEIQGKSKEEQKVKTENFKLFKNTFLGKTYNARFCEIINEDDIILINETDTLKAFASNPILIYNRALGYKESYYLDEFLLNTKDDNYFFSGNILFSEDLATKETNNQQYIKKRKDAYLKSRTYFFRSLWENKLDSAGIIVKNVLDEDLGYDNIVTEKGDKGKYLKHFEYLNHPEQKSFPSTYIIFREKEVIYDSWGRLDRSCITEITLQDAVYFDKNGYFDPSNISWRGKLGNQRIADLLPLEY